jgi:dihydrodipicolinate synthase/N-acetylneuraminate lyase
MNVVERSPATAAKPRTANYGSVPQGVVHSTVTPMTDDFELDTPTFEKLIDFHVRHDAAVIAWPLHKSESLNLTTEERKLFAEVAVKVTNRRVPVIIHVSALATEDTIELARHAEKVGADGVISITPYFWKLSSEAIIDHFTRLGSSIGLPFMAYNSPGYLSGVEITPEVMTILMETLPNFGGVKEVSFNGEKFTELCRVALAARPNFTLMTGVEYLLPSVPLGGRGSYSSAGAVSPGLVNSLYNACIGADYPRARKLQYDVARLWMLFKDQYPSSLKGGMSLMGRPVGPTRGPMPTASPERIAFIRKQLEDLGVFDSEPTGW